jgi:hypothetical protein
MLRAVRVDDSTRRRDIKVIPSLKNNFVSIKRGQKSYIFIYGD